MFLGYKVYVGCVLGVTSRILYLCFTVAFKFCNHAKGCTVRVGVFVRGHWSNKVLGVIEW